MCSDAFVPASGGLRRFRAADGCRYGFILGSDVPFQKGLRSSVDSYSARLRGLEEKVQYQTQSVHLLIRALPCVVLMLVVRIELHVLSYRQQAARIEISGADF